jgi:hypothetical protein
VTKRDKSLMLPPSWHAAEGPERLDALLEHPQPRKLVRSRPVDELYYLVAELGPENASELLALVSPEQWQGFVDLDCWRGEQPEIGRFQLWLEAAMVAGPDTGMEMVGALDEELLTALIMAKATVHEKDLDTDFVPDTSELITSPDGEFWIEIPQGSPHVPVIERTMRLMFGRDIEAGRRVLRAARFEIQSDIEETAFQFRTGRLWDLGFPPKDEAGHIFEPVALRAFKDTLTERLGGPPSKTTEAAVSASEVTALEVALPGGAAPQFLRRVLGHIGHGAARDALTESFVHLSHAVVVATHKDVHEADEHWEAARLAYATVSLGLEFLSDGDERFAARVLERVAIKDVFRSGYSLLFRLARRARAVFARSGRSEGLHLFGSRLEEAIDALRPMVPRRYDGHDALGEPKLGHFMDLSEVRRAGGQLAYAETVLDYFESHQGFDPKAICAMLDSAGYEHGERTAIRFPSLWLTALAHQIVDGRWALEPLTPAAVEHFAAAALERSAEGRQVRPALLATAAAHVESLGLPPARRRHMDTFVRRAFHVLEDAIGGLPPGEEVDPRFIGSVLLLAER